MPRAASRSDFARRRLLAAIQVLWLGLLVGACQGGPPVIESTADGLVRAHDAAAGALVAADFREFRARIREWLPDTRDGRVELWLEDRSELHAHGEETAWADAFTLTWNGRRTPRVHLPSTSINAAERRNLVAHELVHALLGPSWRPLPTALEEGLATYVATRLEPRSYQRVTKLLAAGPERLARLELSVRVGEAPLPWLQPGATLAITAARDTELETVLSYPRGGQLYPEDRGEKLRLYGAGLALVETIVARQGIEGLHELCLRATAEGHEHIPAEWILSAAGAEEPHGRARALRPSLRPEDALWLVDHRQLWRSLARTYEGLRRTGSPLASSPQQFVDAVELRFRVSGGGSASWRELAVYADLRRELAAQLDAGPDRDAAHDSAVAVGPQHTR
jgi:hypothetical protein